MKKSLHLSGSAEEVGEQLQKNVDKITETTHKWLEVLHFDPLPETGLTPKDIVWRKNKAKLYRYVTPDSYKHRTPLLILYALINKAYILDLLPGMSMIEHLVNEGFDVYLLDWGEFGWEDKDISFRQLIDDYISRAVRKVCQFSGVDELSIMGYCMGGTMTAMYASLYPEPRIKNIILLAVPIDFEDAGISSIWLESNVFDVDNVTDTFGLIPKDFIDFGVKILNPVNNYISTYTRLWKSIDEDLPIIAWKALDKWVNDNVSMPGRAYRQWIKYLYQQNLMVKEGFILGGRVVSLAKIECPLLVLTGETDHIVLPHQSTPILDYASSTDTTYLQYKVGHGGLVFGSRARNEVFPDVSEWLAERS